MSFVIAIRHRDPPALHAIQRDYARHPPTVWGSVALAQSQAYEGDRSMIDVPAGIGPVPLIDVVLLGWFALTAGSVAYVAWDAYRNNPELTIMKWGWVLVTLFLGPIGLFLYILSCKGRHACPLTRQPGELRLARFDHRLRLDRIAQPDAHVPARRATPDSSGYRQQRRRGPASEKRQGYVPSAWREAAAGLMR